MSSNKKELIGNFEVTKEGVLTRREILTMGAIAASGLVTGGTQTPGLAMPASSSKNVPYIAKDFSNLAKSKNGFSASQIKEHLKLYHDYISQSNAMHNMLEKVNINLDNASSSYVRDLLTEQSYAVNGVVYHEYYFGNLGGSGGEPRGDFRNLVEERWGSKGKFMDFLKAAGKNTLGWIVVGFNTRGGYVDTFAIDLHKVSVFSPVNMVPLLVIDLYEHAYKVDFGENRDQYLDTVMNNVDWKVVANRLSQAVKLNTGEASTV